MLELGCRIEIYYLGENISDSGYLSQVGGEKLQGKKRKMFKGQSRPFIKALTLKEQDRLCIQNKTPSIEQTEKLFTVPALLWACSSGPAGGS